MTILAVRFPPARLGLPNHRHCRENFQEKDDMKQFHSYGPVDCEDHFCAERKKLVAQCLGQLVGRTGKGGHFFTIWAPRQTGKTWLTRQVMKGVRKQHEDRFVVGDMSMQGLIMEDDDPDEVFFRQLPRLFRESFGTEPQQPDNWDGWLNWFSVDKGLFEKPLILFIDEFDALPPRIIDRLVTLFRNMYLRRDNYLLHGLALIGVRALLGVESHRGSPFNIQRSFHVPNFREEEVDDLYQQYQRESGQQIEPAVIRKIFRATRGQPGLVCWFGELLTEKYNSGYDKAICMADWDQVYRKACHTEWNNTILNLIKKVRGSYQEQTLGLFARSDIPFSMDSDDCAYLYLNGVIDTEPHVAANGRETDVCVFSSPFVQERIYNALTSDIVGNRMPILALEPLDELTDVFDGYKLDLPALLERYKDYLRRLKSKGLNPWKDQPRRADMRLTEAVGHFHLYAWLQNAVGGRCVVSPEFPAGNGKVDIHLQCGEKQGIIEVKSFRDATQLKEARTQAARYADEIGLDAVTVAMFVPTNDESVLEKLSDETVTEKVRVSISAIEWV